MNLATLPQNEHGGQTEIVRNVEVSCFATDQSRRIPLGFVFPTNDLVISSRFTYRLGPKEHISFPSAHYMKMDK